MNPLVKKIAQLKRERKKGLVAFITAGYPDVGTTVEAANTLIENEADIIELGIPFSDPVADGPVIQASSQCALEHGMTLKRSFGAARQIRAKHDTPIIVMSYLNPLIRNGFESTVEKARSCGIDGFVIPDLIPEEAKPYREICRKNGLTLSFLAAPNTPAERLACIDRESTGFVYVVSLTGVTGGRRGFSPEVGRFLSMTEKYIQRHPRFVGFGIAHPAQVRMIKDHADGVIIGSAIIEIIRQSGTKEKRRKRLAVFIQSLRTALDEKS